MTGQFRSSWWYDLVAQTNNDKSAAIYRDIVASRMVAPHPAGVLTALADRAPQRRRHVDRIEDGPGAALCLSQAQSEH
jgi:hypothetical protein